jgi:hypothetical protein
MTVAQLRSQISNKNIVIMDSEMNEYCNPDEKLYTGMTVIEFKESAAPPANPAMEVDPSVVIPWVLTVANDSHLYREGLPTDYNHRIRF